eukprot:352001-Chlamydomonas_euryale.AAC.6
MEADARMHPHKGRIGGMEADARMHPHKGRIGDTEAAHTYILMRMERSGVGRRPRSVARRGGPGVAEVLFVGGLGGEAQRWKEFDRL